MSEIDASKEVAAAEAVDWFLRQREPGFSAADRQALTDWLTRSPQNVEEYLAAAVVWEALAPTGNVSQTREELIAVARAEPESSNIFPLRGTLAPLPAWSRSRGIGSRAILWRCAAALVLVIGACIGVELVYAGKIYSTGQGEERIVALADGSILTLNTQTRVRVTMRAHERSIELSRGECRFQVAKDPTRPFVVRTGYMQARAVGTVFDVRRDAELTQVTVLEGHVAVDTDIGTPSAPQDANTAAVVGATRHLVLAAGEHAVVQPGVIDPGKGQSVEAVVAWTERKLVFRDESLSNVLTEFNRYAVHPLVIDDQELGALRISGVFSIEDPDSLMTYLKGFETVEVREDRNGVGHLIRARTIAPR